MENSDHGTECECIYRKPNKLAKGDKPATKTVPTTEWVRA